MGHDHCDHELKYCGTCDLVYCRECNREWGGHRHYWPWYQEYTTIPLVATAGTGAIDASEKITFHNHT